MLPIRLFPLALPSSSRLHLHPHGLPRESHECRIQCPRQEEVTCDQTRERCDGLELVDAPRVRDERRRGEDDKARNADDREGHAEPKVSQDLGHFDEEVGELEFLGRRAPRHVDLEHVGEDSFRDVDGDATKEDEEHEEPFEILEQGADETAFACTIAHDCEGDVAETVEDDDEGDPDVPTVDVVFVDI